MIFEKNKRKRRYTLATSATPPSRGDDPVARRRNLYARPLSELSDREPLLVRSP
jgi:hypothetical protein